MKTYIDKFKNRNASLSDIDSYTRFSILVPIIETAEGDSLLFEVRSEKLNRQPNEICFPGGRIEGQEESMRAAVRETSEELLLPEDKVEVFGELDTLVTPFNTVIYPFIGILHDYAGTFSPEEVKETFTVPLPFIMETEPLCHYIDVEMCPGDDFPYEMIQQGTNYPWRRGRYPVYFYTYQDRIIWGITARIMKDYVYIMKK
ncbi:MAG: NUDIX hydrolase [Pseudomonadota bacterium]